MEELFDTIIKYGYTIRKIKLLINPKDNIGLNAWKMIKENFNTQKFEINGVIHDKIKVNTKLKEYIENLIHEKKYKIDDSDPGQDKVKLNINGIELDNENEKDHFFIQHYRILVTSNFELSPMKLMQIAYNIGQLKAENETLPYDIKLIEYYKENKLNKLYTFIQTENTKIIKIDEARVQSDVVGGGDIIKFRFKKLIF